MKKSITTCILFLSSIFAFSQTFEWVRSYGSTNYDRVFDMDYFGNLIATVGSYEGSLTYNPSTSIPTANHYGNSDVLLNIYNTSGQLLVSKGFGGTGIDRSRSMTFDKVGNIYIVGTYSGTVDFEPSSMGIYSETSNGGLDAFLAKFNPNGSLMWVKTFGGTANDEIYSVAVNNLNEVVITGTFKGTVDFDPDTLTQLKSSNSNSTDIFLSKFSSNGDLLWCNTFGSNSNNDEGRAVKISTNNDIVLVGIYGGTIDFDPSPSTVNLQHVSNIDTYITKFDTQGNLVFAKAISDNSEVNVSEVNISSSNEIIVSGFFYGTVDFDPNSSSTAFSSSNGSRDIFITKLDSNANFIWNKSLGSASSDVVAKVDLDENDNIFSSGYYFLGMDFDPSPSGTHMVTNGGSSDAYLLKLDKNGLFKWVTTYSGTNTDISRNIVCHNQYVYLAGNASSPVDFDPSPNSTVNIPFYGLTDAFVVKLNDCSETDTSYFQTTCNSLRSPSRKYVWASSGRYRDTISNNRGCDSIINITLFVTNQNTTVNQSGFTLTSNSTSSTFQWIDCDSNLAIVGETSASFTASRNGNFAVELTENGCKDTSACIQILGVGLNESSTKIENFILAPNPSNGNFKIQFSNKIDGEFNLYDLSGKLVFTKTIVSQKSIQLNLKMSKGIYFMNLITTDNENLNTKVVIH